MTVIDMWSKQEHVKNKAADLEALAARIRADEVEDAVQSLALVKSCLQALAKKDWSVLEEADKEVGLLDIAAIISAMYYKIESGDAA